MEHDARPRGMLVGGLGPNVVDAAPITMTGFDYRKIRIIAKGFELKDWLLHDFGHSEIEIITRALDGSCSP